MVPFKQFILRQNIKDLPPSEQARKYFYYTSDYYIEHRLGVNSGGHKKKDQEDDEDNDYVENGYVDDYFV